MQEKVFALLTLDQCNDQLCNTQHQHEHTITCYDTWLAYFLHSSKFVVILLGELTWAVGSGRSIEGYLSSDNGSNLICI